MTYYIIPFAIWAILCVWKALHRHRELGFWDYILALPLIFLSVLRGDVGPDTSNYLEYAQNIIWWNGKRTVDVEFGYVLLVRAITIFTSNPAVVVAVISLIATILFFTMLHLWEDGQCTISLVLVAGFYYQFTMNVLRVGIAFPLAVIAILQLENKRFVRFAILAIASVSVQMTAVILLPMLLLARPGIKIPLKGKLYGIFVGISIMYFAYYLFGALVLYKLAAYSLPSSLESSSGLGPLLISFVCSVVAMMLSKEEHRYHAFIFLIIQIAFYIITTFSYAGIRLQTMALFAQLLALSYCIKRPIRKSQLALVLLLCCLAFSWMTRNFLTNAGEPFAFTPYHFVWSSS